MDIIDIILGGKMGKGGDPAEKVRISDVTMTEDFKLKITFSDGYVYTSAKAVKGTDGTNGRGIVSWVLTETDDGKDVYTVTYTDNTTTTITIQNSKYWHDQAEVVYNNTRALLLNTITVHTDDTTTEAILTPDAGVRYIYGVTLPEWFDPTDLQTNTRYELNFADGNLLVSCWPLS